jgi:RND family efflux transporter MFP subunit
MEKHKFIFPFIALVSLLIYPLKGFTAEQQGPPPALVVVSDITSGTVIREVDFIGTVYYQLTSKVASEVNGKVEEVSFEEGDMVKRDSLLVRLNAELLEKSIEASKESYGQVLSDIERAKIDLKRIESIFKKGLTTESAYDEARYLVKGLEKKGLSLKAEIERLEVELAKKRILAPFDGVIIKKHVERGEWVQPGSPVATLAHINFVDVVVDVPENVMMSVKKGMNIKVRAGGKSHKGNVIAIVPSGAVQTRTFPVKIRIKNDIGLAEGMEARVMLPTGEKKESLLVPRDAVINRFGANVVFALTDTIAKMVPVNVIGFKGKVAGVEAQGLKPGMKVVIKGNERLMDGQTVNVVEGQK